MGIFCRDEVKSWPPGFVTCGFLYLRSGLFCLLNGYESFSKHPCFACQPSIDVTERIWLSFHVKFLRLSHLMKQKKFTEHYHFFSCSLVLNDLLIGDGCKRTYLDSKGDAPLCTSSLTSLLSICSLKDPSCWVLQICSTALLRSCGLNGGEKDLKFSLMCC